MKEDIHILFEIMVRKDIRMRALAEEFLLRHLDFAIGSFLLAELAAVFFALLPLIQRRGRHGKGW